MYCLFTPKEIRVLLAISGTSKKYDDDDDDCQINYVIKLFKSQKNGFPNGRKKFKVDV